MPKMTIQSIEENLRKEVQKMDKRVRLVAVELDKKRNCYRVSLNKDGKPGSAELQTELVEKFLSGQGKDKALRRALGKAVGHLSIRYER